MPDIKYFIVLIACLSTSLPLFAQDDQPMYGGMNRSGDKELAMQDARFIAEATNTFGTREHASIGYVDSGFEAHLNDKNKLAMQRFNEAWLLNPDNPYVYVGFGVLYKKQDQFCDAMQMFDLAANKDLADAGFLADYALIISQCANTANNQSRDSLFAKAISVYQQAEETPNPRVLAYVYQSWAESSLLKNDIEHARLMLDEATALGATIKPELQDAIKLATGAQ
ncbi:MAG: hypothetical protein RIC91_10215 [Gammaproteobacteria bacterium]